MPIESFPKLFHSCQRAMKIQFRTINNSKTSAISFFTKKCPFVAGMHQAGGQGGQPPPQILADQKAPPGSGGAPHYYLPPRIFDPWCIPASIPESRVEAKTEGL